MEDVMLFIERGGEVVYPIMLVIFLQWMYLIERLIYLKLVHPSRRSKAMQEWQLRADKQSWSSRQIHDDLLGALAEEELSRSPRAWGACRAESCTCSPARRRGRGEARPSFSRK